MNRKLEWIINQNRDEQTEPWIRLRYADAAPVKRTPMNRLDLITFLDELIRIDTLRPKVLRDLLKRVAKILFQFRESVTQKPRHDNKRR